MLRIPVYYPLRPGQIWRSRGAQIVITQVYRDYVTATIIVAYTATGCLVSSRAPRDALYCYLESERFRLLHDPHWRNPCTSPWKKKKLR